MVQRNFAVPAHTWTTCTIIKRTGEFCDAAVPEGSPISSCGPHLAEAFRFCQDKLDHAADLRAGIDASERTEQIRLRAEATKAVVYYARCDQRIKIGTTRNVDNRMRSLKADELLAVESGGYDLERRRHRQFDHLRITPGQEYFEPGDDLLEHIRQLAAS